MIIPFAKIDNFMCKFSLIRNIYLFHFVISVRCIFFSFGLAIALSPFISWGAKEMYPLTCFVYAIRYLIAQSRTLYTRQKDECTQPSATILQENTRRRSGRTPAFHADNWPDPGGKPKPTLILYLTEETF